jgi:CDP-paratose 2-epimerase
MENILVTGGAGFLGSTLAIALKQAFPRSRVHALDNLKRRGSEHTLARLQAHGVQFAHGDVRVPTDLELGPLDLILECSAEPSVMAGRDGGARYLIDSNLGGAINCMELARQHKAALLFISSSRVYPFDRLNALPLAPSGARMEFVAGKPLPAGVSPEGLTLEFPIDGVRTIYGATKLSAELLIREYSDVYDFPSLVFRFGVLAGPWQMGKLDQGFTALWVARHLAGKGLDYVGYGGTGHQVRDVLHALDAFDLIHRSLDRLTSFRGEAFNAGGGLANSVSLQEMTKLCQTATGREVPLGCVPDTRPGDIPWYVTDNRKVAETFGWRPRHSVENIVRDTAAWLGERPEVLQQIGG